MLIKLSLPVFEISEDEFAIFGGTNFTLYSSQEYNVILPFLHLFVLVILNLMSSHPTAFDQLDVLMHCYFYFSPA